MITDPVRGRVIKIALRSLTLFKKFMKPEEVALFIKFQISQTSIRTFSSICLASSNIILSSIDIILATMSVISPVGHVAIAIFLRVISCGQIVYLHQQVLSKQQCSGPDQPRLLPGPAPLQN
jgi:hypothetical protein